MMTARESLAEIARLATQAGDLEDIRDVRGLLVQIQVHALLQGDFERRREARAAFAAIEAAGAFEVRTVQ